MFLSFESSSARKISLEGGGNQDPGDPGVGKVRGGRIFFPLSRGGGLTLDDTMIQVSKYTKCCLLIQGLAIAKQAA